MALPLKGRAKFKPPLRGEHKGLPGRRFWQSSIRDRKERTMRRTLKPMLSGMFLIASALFASGAMAQTPPSAPAPGLLVEVGKHKLHIRCVGPLSGKPTVILEAGGGGFSTTWAAVQSLLSARVRTCAYDRAGLGWSEPGPAPRTMSQEVFELHALLKAAKIEGPYVLVGQSIGGLLVRLYAERYSGQVKGMVLVDPTHESGVLYSLRAGKWVRLREQGTGRAVPKPRIEGPVATKYNPDDDYLAEEFQLIYLSRVGNAKPLGDRPLIVLGAGKRAQPPGTSAELWKELREERDAQVRELAGLSRNSKFVLDASSGHNIQSDNPQLVADSIEEVLKGISKRSRLGP